MATPNPKQVVLQRAAADSCSKAGAEMKQAQPPLAKPDVRLCRLRVNCSRHLQQDVRRSPR